MAGVGFKPQHFDDILASDPPLGFIEIHAENYMGDGGLPHAMLRKLCERFSLSIHGVGLSIGSHAPLDREHLGRVKSLCDRYEPASFSEHLAWSTHDNAFLNDLLPLPYTKETLFGVIEHIDQIQHVLDRQILLENPSTYIAFAESTIPEPEFLREISHRTGCGLLLDINNVFVSARNHNTDADHYINALPLAQVRQIHLAGHNVQSDDANQPLLIDAHGSAIIEPVWLLYESLLNQTGPLPTLIEWDNDVPEWPVLGNEARRAADALTRVARNQAA
jgi:uncharacterized protein (UPF0276 family)